MRVVTALFLILLSSSSFSQQKINIPQVDWTITLPKGFVVNVYSDSSPVIQEIKNMIIADRSGDDHWIRTLFYCRKDHHFFYSSIQNFDSRRGKFSDWWNSNRAGSYSMAKARHGSARIDSSSRKITVNGKSFDEYRLTVYRKDKSPLHIVRLARLAERGIHEIHYYTDSKKICRRFERSIKNSKFTK